MISLAGTQISQFLAEVYDVHFRVAPRDFLKKKHGIIHDIQAGINVSSGIQSQLPIIKTTDLETSRMIREIWKV